MRTTTWPSAGVGVLELDQPEVLRRRLALRPGRPAATHACRQSIMPRDHPACPAPHARGAGDGLRRDDRGATVRAAPGLRSGHGVLPVQDPAGRRRGRAARPPGRRCPASPRSTRSTATASGRRSPRACRRRSSRPAASGAWRRSSGRRRASTRPRPATRAGTRRTPPTRRSAPARTGHAEVVLVVFDPARDLLRAAAQGVLGGPRPHAGHAPGQRHRHPVPLGDLLRLARAGGGRAAPAARPSRSG